MVGDLGIGWLVWGHGGNNLVRVGWRCPGGTALCLEELSSWRLSFVVIDWSHTADMAFTTLLSDVALERLWLFIRTVISAIADFVRRSSIV